MSGINKNLPENEKVQCLLCLSNEKPETTPEGTTICSSCGAISQPILQTDRPSLITGHPLHF